MSEGKRTILRTARGKLQGERGTARGAIGAIGFWPKSEMSGLFPRLHYTSRILPRSARADPDIVEGAGEDC
jgi:hypothetical protein